MSHKHKIDMRCRKLPSLCHEELIMASLKAGLVGLIADTWQVASRTHAGCAMQHRGGAEYVKSNAVRLPVDCSTKKEQLQTVRMNRLHSFM